jgi:hypothetical protein
VRGSAANGSTVSSENPKSSGITAAKRKGTLPQEGVLLQGGRKVYLDRNKKDSKYRPRARWAA